MLRIVKRDGKFRAVEENGEIATNRGVALDGGGFFVPLKTKDDVEFFPGPTQLWFALYGSHDAHPYSINGILGEDGVLIDDDGQDWSIECLYSSEWTAHNGYIADLTVAINELRDKRRVYWENLENL